jgi:hypothetical protein
MRDNIIFGGDDEIVITDSPFRKGGKGDLQVDLTFSNGAPPFLKGDTGGLHRGVQRR